MLRPVGRKSLQLDIEDFLELEEFSPSKRLQHSNDDRNVPIFRTSTPVSNSCLLVRRISFSEDDNDLGVFDDLERECKDSDQFGQDQDLVVLNDDYEDTSEKLWRCKDQFSLISTQDTEMLLLAIQRYGKLTDNTMDMIVKLLSGILPNSNCLKKSYRAILASIDDRCHLMFPDICRTNYLCSSCQWNLPSLFAMCQNDKCSALGIKQHATAYIRFCVQTQLEQIVDANFPDMLRYANSAAISDHNEVGDVINGKAYQQFGRNPTNDGIFYINLILSADGASAFKSSSSSIWPCHGLLVELPPKQRCAFENVVLFGFWVGHLDLRKPRWDLFFADIISELLFLSRIGFGKNICGKEWRFKVRLHGTVFDLPALASAWQVKQFNGKSGCICCDHPGENQLYPKRFDLDLKTAEYFRQAWELVDTGQPPPPGVKGRSALSPLCNPATHNVLDPMHMVYHGVAKLIFNKLFVGKTGAPPLLNMAAVNGVDHILSSVVFPSEFNRRVPPLRHLATFKASELKNLLLYAAVPAIASHLQHISIDYWHWMTVFVEAIRILHGPKCTIDDIETATMLLDTWQTLLVEFIGISSQTYNAHAVQHLPQQVWKFGCLWSVSCFAFEAFNGHYTRMVTSGKGVLQQVSRRFIAAKRVHMWMREQLTNDGPCCDLLRQLFPESVKKISNYSVDYDRYHLYDFFTSPCSSVVAQVKLRFGRDLSQLRFAKRGVINGTNFYSAAYYSGKKEGKASLVTVTTPERQCGTNYGRILLFLSLGETKYIAYKKFTIIETIVDDFPAPQHHDLLTLYNSCLYGKSFLHVSHSDEILLCAVEDVLGKFALVSANDRFYAVSILPYEHD